MESTRFSGVCSHICIPGSSAVCVPRSRFAPVKTTSDLFALRSDAYEQTPDGRIALVAERAGEPPVIDLSDDYKMVDSLEGLGMPSLLRAQHLKIRGSVRFADGVKIVGDVSFTNTADEEEGWRRRSGACAFKSFNTWDNHTRAV